MTMMSTMTRFQDPLVAFPPELVLRIISELDVSSLSAMRECSKSWNTFVDVHEEVLFTLIRDKQGRLFEDALNTLESVGGGYDKCNNWRDLCELYNYIHALKLNPYSVINDNKVQSNIKSNHPKIFERFVNTGMTLTWRFKPDFDLNFVVITAHQGGVKVFDLNTSEALWEIPEVKISCFRCHPTHSFIGRSTPARTPRIFQWSLLYRSLWKCFGGLEEK